MNRTSCASIRISMLSGAAMVLAVSPAFSVSKLYPPTRDHTGVLRLAEVMSIATRQDIIQSGVHYQHLLASGIPDAALVDGSLGDGKIYCCGGPNETGYSVWFYVPSDLKIEVGDIVEIRMGRQARGSDKGTVNVATRVREKHAAPNPSCRWDPPNDKLWARILYCDWMEEEGWTLTKGLNKTWLKREPAAPPAS